MRQIYLTWSTFPLAPHFLNIFAAGTLHGECSDKVVPSEPVDRSVHLHNSIGQFFVCEVTEFVTRLVPRTNFYKLVQFVRAGGLHPLCLQDVLDFIHDELTSLVDFLRRTELLTFGIDGDKKASRRLNKPPAIVPLNSSTYERCCGEGSNFFQLPADATELEHSNQFRRVGEAESFPDQRRVHLLGFTFDDKNNSRMRRNTKLHQVLVERVTSIAKPLM